MTDKTVMTAEATEAAALRKSPVIDPADVRLQEAGAMWRTWQLRLPQGAVLGDLNDPGLWVRVQRSSSSSLMKFDRLAIVAWDESWMVETVVASASDRSVTLSKLTRFDLTPRTEVLAGDDDHQIRWYGSGYRVVRRADGHPVTPTAATLQQAERDLRDLYPRPAA
jgi:hypothetical protein